MVGLAPPWRGAGVLGPLESSGSLYLYMRNIRGEVEPCARYRTPNPLARPTRAPWAGRGSFPLKPALNRFGGMGDARRLWGSLARVPSGSGRLSIGPPPRWLTTCPTTQFTLRFPKRSGTSFKTAPGRRRQRVL